MQNFGNTSTFMSMRRRQLNQLLLLLPIRADYKFSLALVSLSTVALSSASSCLLVSSVTMDRPPLILLCSLSFAVVASNLTGCHASLTSQQVYWHAKLPNTPMPSAIRDLLAPSGLSYDENAGTPVGTGKEDTGGTSVGVGSEGVNVDAGHSNTTVGVGKGGVDVNTNHKGKPVTVRVFPGINPFQYGYSHAASDQLRDDPALAFFLVEKDLRPGAEMRLRFTKPAPGSTFLPRQVAHTFPFSSSNSSVILRRFSIDPQSPEAEAVKETLRTCERPAPKKEAKLCATSMESMVDFAMARLGSHVDVLTTRSSHEDSEAQRYRVVGSEVREMMTAAGAKSVTCHRQPYVYVVYYCHETYEAKLYVVALVGEDGNKVEAVAVCHKDTSAWNPKHLAFKVLHVKPGSGPVCHFLPQDHIVWVPSN